MYKTLISLLATLLFVVQAHSQIDFQLGPEVGVGIWGFGSSDPFTNSSPDYVPWKSAGRTGILGLSGRWMFGKHWQVQHGLGYQSTTNYSAGQNSYFHGTSNFTTYNYDNFRRLHQIVMPVTAGFVMGKRKVRASFNAGARLGYVFAAIDVVRWEYTEWPDAFPQPSPFHSRVDFLKGQPRSRFFVQALWSFQMEYAQKLTLGLNLALGPYRNNSIRYHPPKMLPFLSLTYRPFRKEIKVANVGGAALRSGDGGIGNGNSKSRSSQPLNGLAIRNH